MYAGITTDVPRRFKEHLAQGKKAAKYLLAHKPASLAFSQALGDRSLALKVEYHFKELSKKDKDRIVDAQNLIFDPDSGRIRIPDEGKDVDWFLEAPVLQRIRAMESKTVYSTEHGRMCAKCTRAIARCECGRTKAVPKGDGNVRVGRQTKGRKGKGVTLITGLPLDEDELQGLAKELKRKCGTGGTVKNGVIEIQGDHRAMLVDELKGRGYSARLSGG